MNSYDELIEALRRESELSTCSEAQMAANAHMINLYTCLKNKRSSSSEAKTAKDITMDIMLQRLADPQYRFSVKSLREDY
ncbi:hypothetical protein B1748_19925 [Paenibacillus sp. MY03]|uniref:hypothetical protein n=1 Tax=Paenibacillus sp. MY03 TaxID=302980 RepID=UPI000B3D4EEA|nr:hypothetical protein [Paenibacillus sp. MY03]OUS74853.1 hypothetical protein B1748_19925 [Paenibacillus sp. MY03]